MSRLRTAMRDLLVALGVRRDPGDWVVPDEVLACAYPRDDIALGALREAGVRLLVNLHRRAHPDAMLARHGLGQLHLPVRDFSAPDAATLDAGVAAVERALGAGERVAVHCGGGRGRTGTLLACLLVSRGLPPDAAIARVRAARPGAVETPAQEAAVRAFADERRRRQQHGGA